MFIEFFCLITGSQKKWCQVTLIRVNISADFQSQKTIAKAKLLHHV